MAETFLIEDGYTINGKIDRAPGIHPELRFTYRPALSARRNAYLQATMNDLKSTLKQRCDLVCEQVSTWNVTRNDKDTDKPTRELVERLHPLLLDKLVEVILGYSPSGEEERDAKN